jgi:hypothetical protein
LYVVSNSITRISSRQVCDESGDGLLRGRGALAFRQVFRISPRVKHEEA